MKKILLTSIILTLIILMTSNYLLATTISVTEDNFKEHFTKVIGDTKGTLSTMDKNNKTITITASNTIIKYDFSSEPKFTLNLIFTNSMTKAECIREHKKEALLSTMFYTIGDYFNLEKYACLSYYTDRFTAQNNGENIIKIPDESSLSYTDAIDYAKQRFDTDINIQDELFTFTSKKINESSTNYEVEMVLTTNINNDFTQPISNYNGAMQNAIIDAASKAVEEQEKELAREEEALKDFEEKMNNNNSLQTIPDASKQSNSKNKSLPQTGTNVMSFIAIIVLSIILILLSIFNFRNKNIK